MKRAITILGFLALAVLLAAQDKPAPTLSTADRVALSTFAKAKDEAQKQYQAAQESELAVVREWNQSHPGWHLHYDPQGDPKNFTVEADVKPEVKK